MTRLIHLELFTDFFNKIGHKPTSRAPFLRVASIGRATLRLVWVRCPAIYASAFTTAFRPPFEQGVSLFVPNQAALQCPRSATGETHETRSAAGQDRWLLKVGWGSQLP